ncbi:MAG: serine/threonine protein kinase [Polyangiaceae bacterium]|nr:serine/threonine protein kinase [Polyangiaceae bacterium]
MAGLVAGYAIAGKYRLVSPLGRGAMGEVWRAEHALLRSPLAVKILHPQHLDGSNTDVRALMERFSREARTTGALRSPHVVQILDSGQDGGLPFIAMELLEGETLEQRLQRVRTLSPRETLDIVTQIARGIGKAHAAGIVHRDLKPANAFIVRSYDREIVKILDFGIAKIATGTMAYKATQTGMTVGTPAYMSPEQVQASTALDHRADLWSLAVIAFECLTGHLPFDGDSFGALVIQICVKPIPMPSSKARVPPGFDAWFARGVAREPDQRFQSAQELADSLRAVLCPELARREESAPTIEADSAMAWAPTIPGPPPEEDAPTIAAPLAGGLPRPTPARPPPPPTPPSLVRAPIPSAPASRPEPPPDAPPPRRRAAAPPLDAPRPRPWGAIIGAIAGVLVVLAATAILSHYLGPRPPGPTDAPPRTAGPPADSVILTPDPVEPAGGAKPAASR